MSTMIELNGRKLLFTKGASEMVLKCCNQIYNQETQMLEPLTHTKLANIEQAILQMAEESLRTLCFAYKDIGIEDIDTADNLGVYEVEKQNLVFVAIIGVKDIPRPEVPHAIEACKMAGIRVRMVTGDNIVTARAIAREVGIIDPKNTDSLVMEGVDFVDRIGGVVCKACHTIVCPCERDAKKAEEKKQTVRVDVIGKMDVFMELAPKLDVLARSRPTDKYALVTGLKEMGHVVAVTGDGTNDAPALRKADVGFAMGINGTEVARQAAAIILLDDNFNSIVKAVMWGRNIYDSIRKFVQFQLTVNVVAVLLTLIGAVVLK